jgi:HEAT repeat protein
MTRLSRLVPLAALLLTTVAVAAERDSDERTLRDAGVSADGPALLQFFRSRTVGGADRDKIAALIKRLGDDSFDERERAQADLIAIGTLAESQLREAARKSADPEIKRRAEDCLRQVSKESEPTLLAAAARVLGARRPEGAAEVLLAYLPHAPSETVADEVTGALVPLAMKDGKADAGLLKALDDKAAVKRAAAAVALCRAGAKEQWPAVRKLLEDRETAVRLRVALALALARDKEAVPALIELLADVSPSQGYEAEDVLRTLAGKDAPDVPLGKEKAERKKARDAWSAWWKKSGDKVDMAKLGDGAALGRTLIIQRDLDKAEGRVMEVARDGTVRWKIEGLQMAVDAQVLPGDRVLIAEYNTRRLTERTTKGEIVWEKVLGPGTAGMVIAAQRLANGHTFVATRTSLLELDRDGKEVWNIRPSIGSVYAARKSRTGEIAYVALNGTCVRLDADGKEVGSFTVGRVPLHGGIDLLANGNVLVPVATQNKVIEYDAKGKAVWEADVQRPSFAQRLANGHTLVGSSTGRRVVELDANGKEVWKYDSDGLTYKAYRR